VQKRMIFFNFTKNQWSISPRSNGGEVGCGWLIFTKEITDKAEFLKVNTNFFRLKTMSLNSHRDDPW